MKALRIVGIGLGALVALLLVAVGVLYVVFDGEKIKSEISRVVLEQKQRKLVISGTPQLSVWPDVGVSLQGVTLSERNSDAPFMSLDAARVSVAVMPLLSNQVQVRALEVDGLKATLIKHKDGSLNIADLLGQEAAKTDGKPAATASAPAQPLLVDVKAVRINKAQFTWRDDQAGTRTEVSNLSLNTGAVHADTAKQSARVAGLLLTLKGKAGADAFDLQLDAPEIQLSPAQSSAKTLTLSVVTSGAGRNATLKLSASGLQGNTDKLNVGKLSLQLDAKSGDTSVKGQLTSPVSVNVANQSVALSKLAGSIDVASPEMPMKQVTLPIQGALQFNGKAQSASLELNTQFDESKIALTTKVAKFSPLALVFDLDINQLNLDKYLPPAPKEVPAKSTTHEAAKDTPVNLAALKGPNVSGRVRVGALQVANLKLDKINGKINLAGGKLDLAPVSLNLYGGSTSGSISANADGNAIAIKQALVGININPLMKDLLNKDLLEGRGTVNLDVTTRGASVNALKKALAGSASISLKDGAVKGINLAKTLRDAKAKLGKAPTTQAADATQKTDFSELSGSFKIAGGVANNNDLSLKSPFVRLTGAGDIDVGENRMNYVAKATLVATTEGQGGVDLGQVKGFTVPLRISGPFDKLSYNIEWGAMIQDAAKAKVDEKVKEVQTKAKDAVKDKAKDALKGLFGK
jgi:AsmA protein